MLQAILYGGFIAGVLDITDALVYFGYHGAQPIRILQNIANGLVGRRAFDGGLPMAALGLALHFVIAFGAAITYNVAATWIPALIRYPWRYGPMFGVLVFAFMNLVVIPLSQIQARKMTQPVFLNLLFAHIVCVGLPIALAAAFKRNAG